MKISVSNTVRIIVSGNIKKDADIYIEAMKLHQITLDNSSLRVSLKDFQTLRLNKKIRKYIHLSLLSIIFMRDEFILIFSSGGKAR